jgi:hypothetical protein
VPLPIVNQFLRFNRLCITALGQKPFPDLVVLGTGKGDNRTAFGLSYSERPKKFITMYQSGRLTLDNVSQSGYTYYKVDKIAKYTSQTGPGFTEQFYRN